MSISVITTPTNYTVIENQDTERKWVFQFIKNQLSFFAYHYKSKLILYIEFYKRTLEYDVQLMNFHCNYGIDQITRFYERHGGKIKLYRKFYQPLRITLNVWNPEQSIIPISFGVQSETLLFHEKIYEFQWRDNSTRYIYACAAGRKWATLTRRTLWKRKNRIPLFLFPEFWHLITFYLY